MCWVVLVACYGIIDGLSCKRLCDAPDTDVICHHGIGNPTHVDIYADMHSMVPRVGSTFARSVPTDVTRMGVKLV